MSAWIGQSSSSFRRPTKRPKRRHAKEKDAEERQLENILFGVPLADEYDKKRSTKRKSGSETKLAADSSFIHVPDTELFFIDSGEPSGSQGRAKAISKSTDAALSSASEDFEGFSGVSSVGSDSTSGEEDNNVDEAPPPGPSSASIHRNVEPKATPDAVSERPRPEPKSRGPAWLDPSDADIQVSLKDDPRLRKFRESVDEDRVSGRKYENKLRQQFEQINPTPAWASAARNKIGNLKSKRRRLLDSSDTGSEDGVDNLLHSTGDIIGTSDRPKLLPSTEIGIVRFRDANESARSEDAVHAVRFHPSPNVPVLLTAGVDRRLRLFNIDGLTNPLLQTVHLPRLPITNALFHPTGQSVLLTGKRPYSFTYDLQSGAISESPRGLWSSLSFTDDGKSDGDRNMEICKFNSDGKLLAVGGRGGYVHLLHCGKSGASAQVVGSLKMNAPLKDLEWCDSTTGATNALGDIVSGSAELMTVSKDGQVFLWDVGSRRCVRTWRDEGAFGATKLTRSVGNKYWAIGSHTGIVNVYNSDAALVHSTSTHMSPLKSLQNLVHPISTLRFDPSGQILAMASRQKDQLRLVHLPSLTVFSNWPTSSTPLGTVMSVDFSAGNEYLAIGNSRGRVLLYNLRHFGTR